MAMPKQLKPRKNQSRYHEDFEIIKDIPENVAKAIMKQPPKETGDS